MARRTLRHVLLATLVAGTLDILSAFVFAGMAGASVGQVLRYVASGPFGDTVREDGAGWAAAGLGVHFAIMFAMCGAYMLIAPRMPALLRHPLPAGLAYGLLLWGSMYYLVKALRWPKAILPHESAEPLWAIGNQLFSHCILVGIPIALIASRYLSGAALLPDLLCAFAALRGKCITRRTRRRKEEEY